MDRIAGLAPLLLLGGLLAGVTLLALTTAWPNLAAGAVVLHTLLEQVSPLAGVGLALLAPVNPTVGAAYIVNAFLVVVVGGVGSVLGAGVAAALLGSVTALAEGLTSVSLAQAALLVLVVAFLQWKPRGLFPTASRALEDT